MITVSGQKSLVNEYRARVTDLETRVRQLPGVVGREAFPLKHVFGDGLYMREITMPAGYFIISEIHKYEHPFFVLTGECSVATEQGIARIKAPYWGVTPRGTKRVLFIHKETVWVTVHATEETDLKKIEAEVIAKNFDEVIDPAFIEYVQRVEGKV